MSEPTENFFEAAHRDLEEDQTVERLELVERARQLREWLEQESRLLVHDDVTEDERERMEERAETARLLEQLVAP